MKCPNASNDTVANAVKLTGGHFVDLDKAATEICKGNVDQLQNVLFNKVANELEELEDKTEPTGKITKVIGMHLNLKWLS